MGRFSEKVMEHFQDPANRGGVGKLEHFGSIGVPGAGPYFVLSLSIDQGTILDARFDCHGCGASVASGSMLTTMIRGLTVQACEQLSVADLLQALDGLPPDKHHCAAHAVQALNSALESALDSRDKERP